jgi:hypothetical protein
VGEEASFNATEMQVATRDGFELDQMCTFDALETASRELAGNTREGSLE